MGNSTKREYDNSVGEEASAMGERAKGAVKEGWGSVTGNEATKREGERENAEGRARQSSNQVFGSNTGTGRSWVTGTFRDRESAERAYGSLTSRGYSKDDVNLMMSDETRKKYFSDDADTGLGSKAMEGAGTGGAIGGTIGAILASLAAVGTSLAIPGLGIVIAGPIAAALAGAGAGGLTGGIIGALVGAGIPEDRAKLYDQDIRNGGIVMGVNPRTAEDAEYFEREWKSNRGENIYR
ncbi:MAG TPA: CsbD family protein [Blastocatellia bacterium]|nr:CsbD family protein [Blastocatellia bacterium]